MKNKVLVIGASGGIGSAVCTLLQSKNYVVTQWTSKELDLNYPEQIFSTDLSIFNMVINCAGHSQGTYQGFLKNSWQNQLSQINVNYVSNVLLLKHFANSVDEGKYVWCNSTSVDHTTPYKSVYASTKTASDYCFKWVSHELTNIDIIGIKIGLAKTNMRNRNFCGTLSNDEIEKSYQNEKIVHVEDIAKTMLYAIENNIQEITLG